MGFQQELSPFKTNLLMEEYGKTNYNLNNLNKIYIKYKITNKYTDIFNKLFGNILLIKFFTVGIHLLSSFFSNTAFFAQHQIPHNDLVQFLINNCISINNFISVAILVFSYQTVQTNARILPNYYFRIVEKCFQHHKLSHILCFSLILDLEKIYNLQRIDSFCYTKA